MKRVLSFALAFVLIFGLAANVIPVKAASQMTVSDELIRILKMEEGFVKYPQYDYGQYSVGYGTRCPDDMLDYYRTYGITEEAAEQLLRNYLNNAEYKVNTRLIDKYNLTMTQGQFDAVVSFTYNMGAAWMSDSSQNIHYQIVSGADGNALIDAFSRWCNAGGQVLHSLVRRRLSEANMYLNGEYSRSIPDHYCYVTYNGNGGKPTQSVQGYDSQLPAAPVALANYGNYTFAGWYTEQIGGTKVEELTQELNRTTLYAHWQELETELPEEEEPVTVTVTTDDVNLRKGPGTNYAIIGTANTGDTFEILQARENGGYLWGQYDGGWICLQYTNYDEVKAEQEGAEPTEPEETEPEASEPEETEPEASEPEVTQPEETEPETTQPQPTEPEVTQPEETEPETTQPETTKPVEKPKVMGTVHADPYLCVRSGPGTGYSIVDTLRTGEKVEITEQKTVGSMIWGKIASGWISMIYVKLDAAAEPEIDTNVGTQTPAGKTGKVNCDVLNVRAGAGVNYSIVDQYRKNTTVTILEEKTVGSTTWGKTNKGWVSMEYVTLNTQSGTTTPPEQGGTTETPPVTSQGKTGVVTSDDVLRIRSGAGTSYSIVGFLNPGSKVTVTEQKTVGATTWGKIEKGWISMDYVKLDSTSQDNTPEEDRNPVSTVKTVTASCLCIRGGTGTNYKIVGYLYYGAKVTVTEIVTVDGYQWGKTTQGWIRLDYTA